MTKQLNKLNCMNYHVSITDNSHWYAQNGLRSLYTYSKISNKTFKEICTEMLVSGQVELKDLRENDNDDLVLTMI